MRVLVRDIRMTFQAPIWRDKAGKLAALSFSGEPEREWPSSDVESGRFILLLLYELNSFSELRNDGVFVSFSPTFPPFLIASSMSSPYI